MNTLQETPLADIDKIHRELRAGFKSGVLKPIPYRKYQLLQLAYMLKDNEQAFIKAMAIDLGRPALESTFLEMGGTLSEITEAHDNVEKWAKSEHPPFSVDWFFMRPVIRKESKGVILIIAPFNFPLFLSIGPTAGAIAAGNSVLLKPSDQTPATSNLLASLVPKYLDPKVLRIINGGIPQTTSILNLQWDHILYTGGPRVAKIVSMAAAKFLTPVTLELGGKSPVFIDPNGDVEMAARRILWGKTANAGQVCVAPDYVLVPRFYQDAFVNALKAAHKTFYADMAPDSPGAMSRMISPAAFSRVCNLLANTQGEVVIGGETNEADKYIAPTVVRDVKASDSLMTEEIFGPVLPIVPVEDLDEAIAFVNAREHPLALYVFSQDDVYKAKVFNATQSGAAIANEVGIHPGAYGMPFGGIGPSGSGYHTGVYTFNLFTHLRASLDSRGWLDTIALGARFPPYTDAKTKSLVKMFTKKLPPRTGPPSDSPTPSLRKYKFLALAIVFAALGQQGGVVEYIRSRYLGRN